MKALIIVALVWFAQNCSAQEVQDTLFRSNEFNVFGLPDAAGWLVGELALTNQSSENSFTLK
jgi:hypothetical protein